MRRFVSIAAIVLLALAPGCASMCDSSFDCDYHAFGGMRDRIDRKDGRVGSIFDPASALPSVVTPQEVLAPDGQAANTDNPDAKNSQDGSGDSDDDANLRDRLLDELDKLDELPAIPGGPDADQPLDAVDDRSPEV